MPKNTKGGKNVKKSKFKSEDKKVARELEYKEDGQEYAQVTKLLGDCKVTLNCYDGVQRLGVIRGALKKKCWIAIGDIVLVGLREFQNDRADVLHKYTPDEARSLIAYGELPATARINQNAIDIAQGATGGGADADDDLAFDFADVNIDSI